MADYLNRDDVLEVFNDIHPLDYNAQAYLAEIEKLPVVETDKWISTAERQPEESGAYLCRTAKRVYLVVNYSKRHNTWNAFDSENEPKYALEVTHWMPISEPPEEENKTEYIDREAAIKALCERSEPCFTESGEPTFKGDYIGAIASVPAADVVEVRQIQAFIDRLVAERDKYDLHSMCWEHYNCDRLLIEQMLDEMTGGVNDGGD